MTRPRQIDVNKRVFEGIDQRLSPDKREREEGKTVSPRLTIDINKRKRAGNL